MTPSGIETATFQIVAQRLDRLHHREPRRQKERPTDRQTNINADLRVRGLMMEIKCICLKEGLCTIICFVERLGSDTISDEVRLWAPRARNHNGHP
jgi:hypothetical protein